MSNAIKRIVAGVAMAAAVLGVTVGANAATEIRYRPLQSNQPVVMTVNGSEVRADEYATYMLYNMKYYENMYAQYGLVGLWDDPESAEMLGASMPEAARQQALYMRVLLEHFQAEGLKMDGAHQQQMKSMRAEMLDQAAENEALLSGVDVAEVDKQEAYNALIADFGFNQQLYENFMYVSECYSMLDEKLFGEGGAQAPSREELEQYFSDNYLSAKHILFLTIDPFTGEQTRTDEEAKEAAEQALERINAGEDFDTVMNELSEDTGLEYNPDGYIFTEGDMDPAFYDTAKSLSEGQVSDPVQSAYGYHIIKREQLNVDGQLDNYRSALCEAMGKTMDTLLDQWMQEADVQTTDLFDQITYENVYDYAVVPDPKLSESSDDVDSGQAASDSGTAPEDEDQPEAAVVGDAADTTE